MSATIAEAYQLYTEEPDDWSNDEFEFSTYAQEEAFGAFTTEGYGHLELFEDDCDFATDGLDHPYSEEVVEFSYEEILTSEPTSHMSLTEFDLPVFGLLPLPPVPTEVPLYEPSSTQDLHSAFTQVPSTVFLPTTVAATPRRSATPQSLTPGKKYRKTKSQMGAAPRRNVIKDALDLSSDEEDSIISRKRRRSNVSTPCKRRCTKKETHAATPQRTTLDQTSPCKIPTKTLAPNIGSPQSQAPMKSLAPAKRPSTSSKQLSTPSSVTHTTDNCRSTVALKSPSPRSRHITSSSPTPPSPHPYHYHPHMAPLKSPAIKRPPSISTSPSSLPPTGSYAAVSTSSPAQDRRSRLWSHKQSNIAHFCNEQVLVTRYSDDEDEEVDVV